MRATLHIRYTFGVLVPDTTIPIKRTLAVAIEQDVVASQLERRALVLIAHVQGIVQPVLDIC